MIEYQGEMKWKTETRICFTGMGWSELMAEPAHASVFAARLATVTNFGLAFFALFAISAGTSVLSAQGSACQVTGMVRGSQGVSIKDARVRVNHTAKAALTDEKGKFSFQVSDCIEVDLTIDADGYFSQDVRIFPREAPDIDVLLARTVLAKEEVSVTAPPMRIPLSENPAATSIVTAETLDMMPRTVGAEEALAVVPGVKVDNQANQERVHVSIRGQGILSEHGVRGIEVLYDGLPLSDPSGFVPDLYDVDWDNVEEVAVVRGPVGSLYGGGSSGGVIDIATHSAIAAPHWTLNGLGGSNDFYKGHADYSQLFGEQALSLSAGRAASSGYRVHTNFYGDNVSGKLGLKTRSDFRLNFIALGTGYFNQNPEGLNLEQVKEDPRQPNPDALTFNECMKTKRGTGGLTGSWSPSESQNLSFTAIGRYTHYDESVPSSVDHQETGAWGGSLQYEAEIRRAILVHHLSAGINSDAQLADDYRHPNLGGGMQSTELLADQHITERRIAGFAAERLELGSNWSLLANIRFDQISNHVSDSLKLDGLDLSGERIFHRATGRVGVSFSPNRAVGFYASWGQGFLPPATEELYANPDALGGFNVHLKPATSWGYEGGAHGSIRNSLYFQIEGFHLKTADDFERYRIDSRPLETFYNNAGKTSRFGLETELRWALGRRAIFSGAYTYSHFIYSSYVSSVYEGDLVNHRLPNSPNHQLYVQSVFKMSHGYSASISSQTYSKAYIDPTNATYIDGYGLLNARFEKQHRCRRFTCEISVSGRNLTSTSYIAFTEPDPDGNSYQPGPQREIFGGLALRF